MGAELLLFEMCEIFWTKGLSIGVYFRSSMISEMSTIFNFTLNQSMSCANRVNIINQAC